MADVDPELARLFDDFGDLFRDLMQSGGAPASRDVTLELAIAFAEAVEGGERTVQVGRSILCGTCRGTRGAAGATFTACGSCGGTGGERIEQGLFVLSKPCQSCAGKRGTWTEECAACAGTGGEWKVETLTVKVPGGVHDGHLLRLEGKGNDLADGQGPGDAQLTVAITPDPRFTREGDDLHVRARVPRQVARERRDDRGGAPERGAARARPRRRRERPRPRAARLGRGEARLADHPHPAERRSLSLGRRSQPPGRPRRDPGGRGPAAPRLEAHPRRARGARGRSLRSALPRRGRRGRRRAPRGGRLHRPHALTRPRAGAVYALAGGRTSEASRGAHRGGDRRRAGLVWLATFGERAREPDGAASRPPSAPSELDAGAGPPDGGEAPPKPRSGATAGPSAAAAEPYPFANEQPPPDYMGVPDDGGGLPLPEKAPRADVGGARRGAARRPAARHRPLPRERDGHPRAPRRPRGGERRLGARVVAAREARAPRGAPRRAARVD
ncbi:MAG: hypothetical protein M5U28_43610 [Sandaracinaceae bacterium]|nr:hypothetical protein [Sandaracinaceae bacterium]